MRPIFSFLILAAALVLAACTTPAVSTPVVPATLVTPPPAAEATVTLMPSASISPTPQPSATPRLTLPVTVYNRYVGKDPTRQPDLIKTPPANLIPVRSAEGYAHSYIAIFLNGKMVNGEDIRGDPQMLAALLQLFNAAYKAQHTAQTVLSSYRSYDEQIYLRTQKSEENDNFLAPPGRSEHHLGTAVDLAWQTERLNFYLMNIYPRARSFYNWLKENAQHYGFIFSYPYKATPDQTKDNLLEPYITEYKAEPWHIRYVGRELAEKIYNVRDPQGRNYLDPQSNLVPQQFLLP